MILRSKGSIRKRLYEFLAFQVILAAAGSAAETVNRNVPALIDQDREILLATSAAPAKVGQAATVYVLKEAGYVVARRGTNAFACIVERDENPKSVIPVCYDAEGSATVLPLTLREAELRAQGKTEREIAEVIAAGYRDGRFRPPSRGAFAYMLSPDARFSDPVTNQLVPWAPHVMVYAPYLTNKEIGASPPSAFSVVPRLPFVKDEGTPKAAIIVPVRDEDKTLQ